MNLQIKYKIRNNHNKKISIHYINLASIEHRGLSNIIGMYDYDVLDRKEYTGFYDIKGTDIYEGDSVEFYWNTGVIKKKDGVFIIESPNFKKPLILNEYVHLVIIDRDETNKSDKM